KSKPGIFISWVSIFPHIFLIVCNGIIVDDILCVIPPASDFAIAVSFILSIILVFPWSTSLVI
ncbi:MAG: hypothetical protein KJ623_03890, partial [Nanoarchaeota archaeon]|nr:hypothetical protein [Nanoarchaeota archaeon]